MQQTTSKILLVKPTGFGFNEQTAVSNTFQSRVGASLETIRNSALNEFENFVHGLRKNQIEVLVFEDGDIPEKPDAVFPNNWISMHEDGTVILYPMQAANRRPERSEKLIENIKRNFEVKRILDLSFYENENRFLEGTGSIVFDHENRKAFACLSPRTDLEIVHRLCSELKYDAIVFNAVDQNDVPIYHTNVMMAIAPRFAVICLESIADKDERQLVTTSLKTTGHEIVDISFSQMNSFAGNMLAVQNKEGKPFLIMSQSAFDSLNTNQMTALKAHCTLLPLDVRTIETVEGGSARCMMAEIFLSKKKEFKSELSIVS